MSEIFEFIPEILTTAKMVMDTVDDVKRQTCPLLYYAIEAIGLISVLVPIVKRASRKRYF